MCYQHPRFTGFSAHFYNVNFVMEQEVLRRWYSSVSIMPFVLFGCDSFPPHQYGLMKGSKVDVHAHDHGS